MKASLSPIRILIFFVSLAAMAFFVLPYLKVDLLPKEQNSELQIQFSLPNTSPLNVESTAMSLLENALSSVRGVKKLRSVSRFGQGVISLTFERKEDMAARRFEVASIIRSVFPKLPQGSSYPQLSGGDNSAVWNESPTLLYSVEARGNAQEVREKSERFFRQTLHNEPQVAYLAFQGGQEKVLVIEAKPEALSAYQLNVNELQQAIQQIFGNYYLGSSQDNAGHLLFIRSVPASLNISAITNTLIKNLNGYPLRLSQVAKVYEQWQAPDHYYRINGKNAASVEIYLNPKCNKVYEAERIQAVLTQAIQGQSELGIRLENDQTVFVREELKKNWIRLGASLIILCALLLLTYRNIRLVLILLFCLAINIALTILCSWVLVLDWHTYTLAGMSVSFGLMIDNAVVMLDSYRRRLNRRIFTALLGATLTTIAALFLVFFLPAEQQRFLFDFCIIIMVSLCTSLLCVLFLIPACYDLWIGKPQAQRVTNQKMANKRRLWKWLKIYGNLIGFLHRWRVLLFIACILLFGLPFFLLPLQNPTSHRALNWLNAETFQQVIRPKLEKWLGGTLRAFALNFKQENYYQESEETVLYLRAELPNGHTLAHMNGLMQRFENYLTRQKEIELFTTQVLSGQHGAIEIHFTEAVEKTTFPLVLQVKMQEIAQQFSGVQWNIYGKGQSFSNNLFMDGISGSRLILKGYDYKELERQAEKLGQFLAQNMRVQKIELDQNIDYFERPLPEMYLTLDANALAERKTELNSIMMGLQEKTSSNQIFLDNGTQQVLLVLQAQSADQFDVFRLLNESIPSANGSALKIKDVGKMALRQSSSSIHRENRQYLRMVTYDYVGSFDLARELHENVIKKMTREMPLGYSIEAETGSMPSETGRQFYLLLILLAANFIICAMIFEHLLQPFFILLTVPFSFIGIFVCFAWGNFSFDQGGFASFIMLGGIVVNASIFLINDLNNKAKRVLNFRNTLIKVFFRRSGTILLTIFSTICGFIPFLYEGPSTPFWFSLALGTSAGLLMSIFAVFIILPVLLWKKLN